MALSSTSWSALAAPEAPLLAGARAFSAGRFEEALRAFREAADQPGGEAARWYCAATLLKLGRTGPALWAFLDAEARAPEARDELLDFYFALACHEAKLYTRAVHLLASVSRHAGPRVAAQAAAVRSEVDRLLATPPALEAVDWYLRQGDEALRGNNPSVARAFFEEAREAARRRAPPYRLDDALTRLRRLDPTSEAREEASSP